MQAILIFTVVASFSGILGKKVLSNSKLARKINLTKASIFALIGLKLAFTD